MAKQVTLSIKGLGTLLWCMGKWRVSYILNLKNRWRWVVSFMHWFLYHHGKSTCYLMVRRLGRSQSQS